MIVLKKEIVTSLFILAGIEIKNIWELKNQYWPESYPEMILKYPWWLVETPFGFVQIGTRKRVIEIDWIATGIRKIITEDDVTKDYTIVHAWSIEKVLEYLKSLRKESKLYENDVKIPLVLPNSIENTDIQYKQLMSLYTFLYNNVSYKLLTDNELELTYLITEDLKTTGIIFNKQLSVYFEGVLVGDCHKQNNSIDLQLMQIKNIKLNHESMLIDTNITTENHDYFIAYMLFVSKFLIDQINSSKEK